MLDDLYTQRLVALAADIPSIGRLPAPEGTSTRHARLCGSSVTVDVALRPDGRVEAFAQEVKACLLGQASASLVARHALGMDLAEARGLQDAVSAMLRDGGAAPSGAHAAFAVLEGVRGYKARHASTMLAFEALAEAIGLALESRSPGRSVA